MKVAAIADLHCRADSSGKIAPLLECASEADALLLPGDLTDTGLVEEAEVLLDELAGVEAPIVAVLGNHDHESDHAEEIVDLLKGAGVRVLDGSACQIGDVGFVGTKGFAGGFGERIVQPFGERALKAFIRHGIEEARRLESATAGLTDCRARVALLHYAPVSDTLEGEPEELWPLLGSTRFASALDRHDVTAVVHGHAHYGFPEGETPGGAAVYNVCRFVHDRHDLPACRVFEV
ncbi:MAG: metallophosphoesterase [Gemmatimonadota bacterium]|nr:metallophosphoesterase [Gemmatimonadota bacterium]